MSEPSAREIPAWQQALSEALAEGLPRLFEEPAEALTQELIAALTAALCRGEVELALDADAPEEVTASCWPEQHRRALLSSRLSREPDGPLVLVDDRLAWRRWHQRQQTVLHALLERARSSADPDQEPGESLPAADPRSGASPEATRADVEPGAGAGDHSIPAGADAQFRGLDAQQGRAVRLALSRRLVLLLGGPGTGKTSTISRLLEAYRQRWPEARIHLAAPTGKAAARLRAATAATAPCTTLHRLLESRGDGFGRGRQRPLALDLLVIDELSMVDLELMEALLEALPDSCRLVLVGDPAQLPPIAPGPVLQALEHPSVAASLRPVRVELVTTYRNQGAIARVATALRSLLADGAELASSAPSAAALTRLRPLLEELQPGDNLIWHKAGRRQLPRLVLERLREHQRSLARLARRCWPDEEQGWAELLAERDRLLVLSPVRRGRWGLEALHRALLGGAAEQGGAGIAVMPSGTPLLCRRNLPDLGLANGDIGVLVVREASDGQQDRRLLFGQDSPLWLHPAQLAAALEPALALTVHKAQGSEAREVMVLLEDAANAEPRLIYTALTRARDQAVLITPGFVQ